MFFADPLAYTFADRDHSHDEERLLTLGLSLNRRLLVVSHSERSGNVRIISAREATRHERKIYEEKYKFPESDTRRPAYQPEGLGRGVRGKYQADFQASAHLVRLAPDVAEVFGTPQTVKNALRSLIAVAVAAA